MNATGIVAALAFEARCLGAPKRDLRSASDLPLRLSRLADGSLLCLAGMGGQSAAAAAQLLVRSGAGALLSWGVAGALDPGVRCGSAVLATQVRRAAADDAPAPQWTCDVAWRERLAVALAGHVEVVQSTLLTSERPVASVQDKALLFQATQAAAVDMESAAVAEAAAQHGLPFMALRIIVDTAHDSVPESVLRAFAADGARGSPARRLAHLMRAPADWAALLRLAWRYRRARRSLRRCARFGAPMRRGAQPDRDRPQVR